MPRRSRSLGPSRRTKGASIPHRLTALRYYAAHADKIHTELAMADESRAAEEAWRVEQHLLA